MIPYLVFLLKSLRTTWKSVFKADALFGSSIVLKEYIDRVDVEDNCGTLDKDEDVFEATLDPGFTDSIRLLLDDL